MRQQQRLLRWKLRLQKYGFEIKYRVRRLNEPADALSRLMNSPTIKMNEDWINIATQKKKIDHMQQHDKFLAVLMKKVQDEDLEFMLKKGILVKKIMKNEEKKMFLIL